MGLVMRIPQNMPAAHHMQQGAHTSTAANGSSNAWAQIIASTIPQVPTKTVEHNMDQDPAWPHYGIHV